jgi:hypothetical protein
MIQKEVQMLKSLIAGLLVASAVLIASDSANKDQGWKPTPLMRAVSPDSAKVGEVLTVTGEYLDKSRVKEVYLTDSKSEFKLEIVEQGQTLVKVKISPTVKPGRWKLMVLTAGVDPQLLEQPVSVEIQ